MVKNVAVDAAWLEEARPEPDLCFRDPGSGSPEIDFTNRNRTFMSWKLLHMARMLKDAGGNPADEKQRFAWDTGCRFDYANPDFR